MERDKSEFEVELVVTSRHLITTYSRTSEEAERDAEELFADGEEGVRLSYEVEYADASPTDDLYLPPEEVEDGE